jgi:hypothetical protein
VNDPNDLVLLLEEVYDSILALGADYRGYLRIMRDALCDETGRYHVAFDAVLIRDNDSSSIVGTWPTDDEMLEFLGVHSPSFFLVPFRKFRKLDPDELDALHIQLAEVTRHSAGLIDTFFLADTSGGIMATVTKDEMGLYRVLRSKCHTILREDFRRHFSEQYARFVAGTESLGPEGGR